MTYEDLIFSTIVYPGTTVETDVILLCESIRRFAGSFAPMSIWCFVPQYGKVLTAEIEDRLHILGVTLSRFEIDKPALRFPFMADARAAALAETQAQDKTDILVWLTANTLVLREPSAFMLPADKTLAYRPVHHTLVGSRYGQPLDPFWTQAYKHCSVSGDRVFPMLTHVDNTTIRPYFNAGILVTRPVEKLLHSWYDMFVNTYEKDEFRELYRQDERYTIFMHQAILTGVILSRYRKKQLLELPRTYNYPLHLYNEDVTPDRPSTLEELVTVRHEGFYKDPEWSAKMPAGKSLKTWLETVLEISSND